MRQRGSVVLLVAAVCLHGLFGAAAALDAETLKGAMRGVARTWMDEEPAASLSWNWGEGVLLYGLLEAYRALDDPAPRAYVEEYMQHHLSRGIRVFWSDKTTPALAAAELALADNITAYWPLVEQVMQYVMEEAPRTPNQQLIYHLGKVPIHFIPRVFPDLWVDSLFHWVPTLHRVAAVTGDDAYSAEAVFQLEGFLRNLQDPATSFITHAYNDDPLDQQIPSFEQRAFWARGNGWMFCAIVDTLDYLPLDHPARAGLVERLLLLDAAVRAAQAPSGLFHTVLLNSTTYLETAGSALLTYAMARGARIGVLGAESADAAERGMEGLLSVLVYDGDRVLVNGTSLGTGPRPNLYPYIPTAEQVTYGVGAWLMAARELLLQLSRR